MKTNKTTRIVSICTMALLLVGLLVTLPACGGLVADVKATDAMVKMTEALAKDDATAALALAYPGSVTDEAAFKAEIAPKVVVIDGREQFEWEIKDIDDQSEGSGDTKIRTVKATYLLTFTKDKGKATVVIEWRESGDQSGLLNYKITAEQ